MDFRKKKRRASFVASSCALAVFFSSLASAVAADGDRVTVAAAAPSIQMRELDETPRPSKDDVVASFTSSFERQEVRVFVNSLAYGGKTILRDGVACAVPEEYLSSFSDVRCDGDALTAFDGALSFSAVEGEKYVTANGRCFYCPGGVVSEGGDVFAPISALASALGMRARSEAGEVFVEGEARCAEDAGEYYNGDDLYWLSRIISCESMSESFEGKIAVGNVVLNRVRSADFPSDVKGVVFDSRYGIIQFSPVRGGYIYNEPDAESVAAAKVCLEGVSLSDEILYFMNPALATTSWIADNREAVMTIGHHTFYS